VDDGAPVNLMHWTHPDERHAALVPASFTRRFADVCDEYGVKGKFTILPAPCGLGRIDQRLAHVPPGAVRDFLEIVRRRLAPRFDITPELLTHSLALRPGGGLRHLCEDEWVARATVAEMTDYLALALRILRNVGLPANGVTSPWNTGASNEQDYARAIAAAQWRVHRRRLTWYFLHIFGAGPGQPPRVAWRNRRTGQTVVSVPATTPDAFWAVQYRTGRAARRAAAAGATALLAADGKSGRIRELLDQPCPIVLLTHWQSLFAQGSAAGLCALDEVLRRVRDRLGDQVVWVTCSQLARASVAGRR